MSLEPNAFTTEISNALATAGTDYMTTVVDLGEYGTSYEISKHGSDRKLHITPVDSELIDMALFDSDGTTIASGTLFAKTATDITTEELTNLVTMCF